MHLFSIYNYRIYSDLDSSDIAFQSYNFIRNWFLSNNLVDKRRFDFSFIKMREKKPNERLDMTLYYNMNDQPILTISYFNTDLNDSVYNEVIIGRPRHKKSKCF
jgi:hypothetical protein